MVDLLAVVSVVCQVGGSEDHGPGHQRHLRRGMSRQINARESAAGGRLDQGAGRSRSWRRPARPTRPRCWPDMDLRPGQGVDFAARGQGPAHRAAIYLLSALFAWLQGYLMAGHRAADGLPAAARSRPEDRPSAPQVLRRSRPRRHPQPADQRHRQHPADHAAGAHADHHRLPHPGRRAGHDVLDQPAARAHLARRGAGVGRSGHGHRQALAEAVRPAVGAHRRSERPRGGDVHRPQHREDLRPPERGHRRLRRAERRGSTRPASRPSSSRASSCRS